jgi:2-polyprenyl-3-methyl-5-hydroxy-6-metoxy-1,4-benzoquinol methylase
MMDFDERVIPDITANFLYMESLSRYKFCLNYLDKSSKSLDLGCGTGYGTSLLSLNCQIAGIDINPEAIDYAIKHYGKTSEFIVGDISSLSHIYKNSYDFICSFEVIEHLRKPKVFLGEVKRILKPNGYFILSTPNKIVHSPNGKTNSRYHVREYKPYELEKLLTENFSSVKMYGQSKSRRAIMSINKFMNSQLVRQKYVNSDFFNLRKIIPKSFKEKIWKYLGAFYGREAQNQLTAIDFPIGKLRNDSEYIIAVCKK